MNTQFVKRTTSIWIIISLIGVGAMMYVLGRIDGIEGAGANIVIQYPDEVAIRQNSIPTDTVSSQTVPTTKEGSLVASKNGGRYYTPGCSGIDRILPENRIYFSTEEEAKASGRTLAKACQ